ncbi:sugar ABC transporter permease [Litorilinea aerophila]|uniref:Sugar ABC transporter permease n=1 Tax=Litorilinea aerophila TaxID=1204385 RepID=A0A540VH66_9CHLR|nr:sugar ABC transporter permease [Litorilinea aerophila]MCC9076420.1 sugar ABC transporter permease [Litorilinea aerophila]OUC05191.1 ABC transporter permease [Litorilinea aerophila]GIV79094.1 MAG: ABC transporter permease [Litorilinea sp.]
MQERYKGLLLILPSLLVMALFTVYPLVDGLRMAFTNANLLRDDVRYVGMDNFRRMLQDDVFWISLYHSVLLTVVVVLLQLIGGLILASAMRQDLPGMGFFKSIIMASWVIPVAATVIMFKFMAQPDVGLINILLRSVGLERLNKYWLGDPQVALPFIMMLHLWRNVPFYGVAFLAAMQAIPRAQYEAAEIDGANAWDRFRYVTLPGIRNMIVVMVTIHVLWTFNNFDFVYLATGGGPVNATDVLPVYVYRLSWNSYSIGYASSVGTVMLILLMLYFVVYVRLSERQAR